MQCDKMVVYEHEGSVTEKVHIHILMINSAYPVDTLKKQVKTMGAAVFKGNGDWSFKTKDKKYGPVSDSQDYVTYMTKGIHEPKYNKGYLSEYIDECKKQWVDKSKTSKLRLDYNAFCRTLQDLIIPKNPMPTPSGMSYEGFDTVKRNALKFAYSAHDNMISPQALQMMKSLTLTYCYENHVVFDKNYLWK